MSFPVFDILARRAELGPERVAFEDISSGEQINYFELNQRAGGSAALLAELGIKQNDCVALLCRNRIEFFELLFACARLGAILVPLNWRMPARELAPLLDDCRARLLIYGTEDADTAINIAANIPLLGQDDSGDGGFCKRRNQQRALAEEADWPADKTWYLLYTSGTTGKPKAVIQTYGMALANYINIAQAMGLQADDTSLNYLPLFHTAGINLVTLPTLIEGGEVLVIPGFELEEIVKLIAEGALDTFFGVPACYQQISLHPAFDGMDLSKIRNWGCGGAPMPDHLVEAYLERGARVCNGMGMTETGPTAFIMDEAMVEKKIGSVGKPQVLASVRLVGEDGNDVAQGEEGELWFAGPGITPGYWGNEQATSDAFAEGRWLRSGDIGRQDEDGYYYIAGRIKDMFISGGENVYPAEVENVLAAHPDILEAAVVAMADEKWGEVGCAYLMAQPGHDIPVSDELESYCRERLAADKVPRQFVTVPDFPRTAAGKVQKHLLKQEDLA